MTKLIKSGNHHDDDEDCGHSSQNSYDEETCQAFQRVVKLDDTDSGYTESTVGNSYSLSSSRDDEDSSLDECMIAVPVVSRPRRRQHGGDEAVNYEPWLEDDDPKIHGSHHRYQRRSDHFRFFGAFHSLLCKTLLWSTKHRNQLMVLLGMLFLLGVLFDLGLTFVADQVNHLNMEIGDFSLDQGRQILDRIRAEPRHTERGFTLRLTGSALPTLHASVQRYSQCSIVKRLQVHWGSHEGRRLPSRLTAHAKVEPTSNPVETSGAMLLDSDNQLSCSQLERAYSEWKRDTTRLVGFEPLYNEDKSYGLVSDRGVLGHSLVMEAFFNSQTANSSGDCLEYLGSAKWAAISQQPPTALIPFSKDKKVSVKEQIHSPCYQVLARAFQPRTLPRTNVHYTGRSHTHY